MSVPAEIAYLFRHAILRHAAYDLQTPQLRAALHAMALEIMEGIASKSSAPEAWCEELADHARNALNAEGYDNDDLLTRELKYLRSAAVHESGLWHNDVAVSLRERIWKHTKAGAADKFNALREAMEVLVRSGRPNEAPQLADLALELAEQDGSEPWRSEAQALKAQALGVMGRYDEAETLNRQSMAGAEASGDVSLQGRILTNIASVAQARGKWEESESAARRAWELLSDSGNDAAAARSKLYIGDSCWHQGKLTEAEQHFRTALESYCRLRNLGGEATARDHLGSLLRELGRDQEARHEHEQAARIYSDIGDTLGYGSAISNLATNATDLNEARRHRLKADELFRSAGATYLEGVGQGNLATIERRLGLLESSSQRFQRARDQLRRSGRVIEQAVFDALFGQLLLLLGFHEAAATNAMQAGEVLERVGASHWRAQYVSPLEVRLCVARMLNGSAEAGREARDVLEFIERTADAGAAAEGSMLEKAIDTVEALLAEAQKPEPQVFNGHMVTELEPPLRLALLDRAEQVEPTSWGWLAERPWLLQAMREGTDGLPMPDWAIVSPMS